jgi:RNA polymerase sigma-54 factor
VRERVRAVIGAEDPTQPLSDDEVVAALRQHGHTLARRTVAKYRKELGIPSSYRRRRYGA